MPFSLADFHAKFNVQKLALFRTNHWMISLRPDQLTLGSLLISPSVEAHSFTQLTNLHPNDNLLHLFASSELVLKRIYGAKIINIYCLMLVDPIIHFHVFPRYSSEVFRYDREWIDRFWPGALDLSQNSPLQQNTLLAIHQDLSVAFASL